MRKPTKESIEAKCRQILLTKGEVTGEDYDLVLSLFLVRWSNPNPSERLRIKVDQHPLYTHNNCFFFFNGNKWEDFSFLESLDHPSSLMRKERMQAFRNEILDQIFDYMADWLILPENREFLALYRQDRLSVHVDYIYPFSSLLADFLAQNNILIDSLDIHEHDTSFYPLRDREIAKKWQCYHRQNASLRLLYAKDNLQKSNKVQVG
jgi:hypothetical protein